MSKPNSRLRIYSHQATAGDKAKKIKEQAKRSKTKRQTSKKMFTFASVFARCEWVLKENVVVRICRGHCAQLSRMISVHVLRMIQRD